MKFLATTLLGVALTCSSAAVFAQDGTKTESMPRDGMMKKEMTTDDCKAHMATMKKDGVMKDNAGNVMNKDGSKRDEAMMKSDTMCMEMMNKSTMPSDSTKK